MESLPPSRCRGQFECLIRSSALHHLRSSPGVVKLIQMGTGVGSRGRASTTPPLLWLGGFLTRLKLFRLKYLTELTKTFVPPCQRTSGGGDDVKLLEEDLGGFDGLLKLRASSPILTEREHFFLAAGAGFILATSIIRLSRRCC